jgi:hypothetical protein
MRAFECLGKAAAAVEIERVKARLKKSLVGLRGEYRFLTGEGERMKVGFVSEKQRRETRG